MIKQDLERLHTRIKKEHKRFLEDKAREDRRTEAEVLRIILDEYIDNNKK